MAKWSPVLARDERDGELSALSLGHPLVDAYLEFAGARARPNTWLAHAYDLKVFFSVVAKEPVEVKTSDVLAFIAEQRKPRYGHNVLRLEDREPGLSARTIKRRLATVSGFYAYLLARGDTAVGANPVPRGLSTRPHGQRGARPVPLLRTARTLPRVHDPEEVNALVSALRTRRDRAMVEAMVLGGLRRCEVLGLTLGDLRPGERRVLIANGKGGHQRIVPMSARFFASLAAYLELERPPGCVSETVFVVLKGPNRGRPLSERGLDEVMKGARKRAGLGHLTCHELRHTCLTRLRESGMSLEALQAQAGHRSIESTRMYLHLSNDWLSAEYLRAIDMVEALIEAEV
ncbi:MAG TPA: tyrosine-type recombinase/integrase [Acidimicrobiales bacterium]|nr:tyrosine-type recombinase/integrase [Acidimicrobiales bacterium]HTW09158.1 tyrosine-type recombinase/integrase [Acidimicrobiales bacterium]